MIDSRHFEQQLIESDETRPQIAFADVIVLNKNDLVGTDELRAVERRVRSIIALARIERADPARRAAVPTTAILGIGGFDLARALEYKPTFLEPEYSFEWAGAYALEARNFRIVLHEGPDPSMQALLCEALPADRLDPRQRCRAGIRLVLGRRREHRARCLHRAPIER